LRLSVHKYRGSNVLSLKLGKNDVGGVKNGNLAEHRKNEREESVGVSKSKCMSQKSDNLA